MSAGFEPGQRAATRFARRATREAPLRAQRAPERSRALAVAGGQPVRKAQEPRQVPRPDRWGLATLNVIVALGLLVISAPVMAVAALLVRLTSPGPVLYSQVRVGIDRRVGPAPLGHRRRVDIGGKPIRIFKFRTMAWERKAAGQVWTEPNDRRITWVGRFLRAYRIDEFPQLVNVLRREMNVVGPRPEQPEIFARLREVHERFPERQRVLPGITGLAQVECGYGGDDFQMRRKLECDLEYVEGRDLFLDLAILVRTVPVVLLRRGAR